MVFKVGSGSFLTLVLELTSIKMTLNIFKHHVDYQPNQRHIVSFQVGLNQAPTSWTYFKIV